MFKYIWIIIIGLAVAAFVTYTFYCCNRAYKDAESLEDWWNNMDMDHCGLLVAWEAIFIISAIILFVSSLVAFCSSFG